MLKSSLCDYSDAYILVSGTVAKLAADGGNVEIQVVFKYGARFNDCMSEINNTQIDNAKAIYVVMPMYSLIEYNNNYSRTPGDLWQYYRDKAGLIDGTADDFPGNSASLKFNQKKN